MLRITLLAGIISLFSNPLTAQDFDLGLEAYTDGDYATALKEFQPLAEGGNVEAQYALAMMYRYGDGVSLDYVEAMRLFRLAATYGHPMAPNAISLMYLKGEGVPPDPEKAYLWSDIAAAADFGSANAAQLRDAIASELTPEQIANARNLLTTCTKSGFTECGE